MLHIHRDLENNLKIFFFVLLAPPTLRHKVESYMVGFSFFMLSGLTCCTGFILKSSSETGYFLCFLIEPVAFIQCQNSGCRY